MILSNIHKTWYISTKQIAQNIFKCHQFCLS